MHIFVRSRLYSLVSLRTGVWNYSYRTFFKNQIAALLFHTAGSGQGRENNYWNVLNLWLQLGIALGFLIPPRIVKDHEDVEQIGEDLRLLFYSVAGVCTALLLCVLLGKPSLKTQRKTLASLKLTLANKTLCVVFKAKPPLPPSVSAARAFSSKRPTFQSYVLSIKSILSNKGYILLLFTYGVNVGVFYAMSTLLNQTVLQHFPVCVRVVAVT